MRTLLRFTACAAVLAAFSTPTRAQGIFGGITKKISDAASQKAQDKVNGKIDEMTQKMVDKSFDSMFGSSAKPAATAPSSGANTSGGSGGAAPAGASASASPFWNNSDAKTESSYTFNVVTTMEIASSKNADKAIFKMHYNTNAAYSGTLIVQADPKKQQGTAFVVLDAKNQVMVMLMTSDKSKSSMAFGWNDAQKYAPPAGDAASGGQQQVNWDTVKVWKNFSKIGSKTILGYSADGYHLDTADGSGEIWVSHDPRLNVGSMFGASSSLKQMQGRVPEGYPQGTLLLMTAVSNKTGETVTMTVTDIDTNANITYNMSDYPRAGAGKK